MNTVGMHQCDLGQHRFKWAEHCRPTGFLEHFFEEGKDRESGGLKKGTPVGLVSADELIAVNADCDGCDMTQYNGIGGGVVVDAMQPNGIRIHRNAKPPSLPKDGHFIRLVMGCGNSIPSIDAYGSGRVIDGGLNGGAEIYTSNGIGIWSEITNCTYTSWQGAQGLRSGRSGSGTWGHAPCFPGSTSCISKRGVIGSQIDPDTGHEAAPPDRDPTPEERKYNFAGRCMNPVDCGPKGPCVNTECCTYTGRDQPYFATQLNGKVTAAPLWSGAVACSQGGDLEHLIECKTHGFDPLPNRPPEQFTVHYVKDVNPVTGEATLVIPAYPLLLGACIVVTELELLLV